MFDEFTALPGKRAIARMQRMFSALNITIGMLPACCFGLLVMQKIGNFGGASRGGAKRISALVVGICASIFWLGIESLIGRLRNLVVQMWPS
jgi:hypothetical protein